MNEEAKKEAKRIEDNLVKKLFEGDFLKKLHARVSMLKRFGLDIFTSVARDSSSYDIKIIINLKKNNSIDFCEEEAEKIAERMKYIFSEFQRGINKAANGFYFYPPKNIGFGIWTRGQETEDEVIRGNLQFVLSGFLDFPLPYLRKTIEQIDKHLIVKRDDYV